MTSVVPQQAEKRSTALAAAMAIPGRNSSPEQILNPARTFFAMTKNVMGKRLLQTERAENPVKAGLARSADEYPYCFANLAKRKVEGQRSGPSQSVG
jgi:hypothetical protein